MGPCEDLSHLTPTLSMMETVCIVQTSTSAMVQYDDIFGHVSYSLRSYHPRLSSEVISSEVIV